MGNCAHAGAGREFSAFARPQGDARAGVSGPLLEIHERRRHCLEKVRVLSRAEAEQLHAELGAALRAFAVGEALASPDRAAAYTGPYPIRGATLADVEFG